MLGRRVRALFKVFDLWAFSVPELFLECLGECVETKFVRIWKERILVSRSHRDERIVEWISSSPIWPRNGVWSRWIVCKANTGFGGNIDFILSEHMLCRNAFSMGQRVKRVSKSLLSGHLCYIDVSFLNCIYFDKRMLGDVCPLMRAIFEIGADLGLVESEKFPNTYRRLLKSERKYKKVYKY